MTDSPQFKELLEKGFTGRTAESGFYRGRDEVYDFEKGDYRPKQTYEVPKDPQELMESGTPEGNYAREVFRITLQYCCDTAEEIAATVDQIDIAMELGYGWKKGPFALADAIGHDYVASLFDTVPALLESARSPAGSTLTARSSAPTAPSPNGPSVRVWSASPSWSRTLR